MIKSQVIDTSSLIRTKSLMTIVPPTLSPKKYSRLESNHQSREASSLYKDKSTVAYDQSYKYAKQKPQIEVDDSLPVLCVDKSIQKGTEISIAKPKSLDRFSLHSNYNPGNMMKRNGLQPFPIRKDSVYRNQLNNLESRVTIRRFRQRKLVNDEVVDYIVSPEEGKRKNQNRFSEILKAGLVKEYREGLQPQEDIRREKKLQKFFKQLTLLQKLMPKSTNKLLPNLKRNTSNPNILDMEAQFQSTLQQQYNY